MWKFQSKAKKRGSQEESSHKKVVYAQHNLYSTLKDRGIDVCALCVHDRVR